MEKEKHLGLPGVVPVFADDQPRTQAHPAVVRLRVNPNVPCRDRFDEQRVHFGVAVGIAGKDAVLAIVADGLPVDMVGRRL